MTKITFHNMVGCDKNYWRADLPEGWFVDLQEVGGQWKFSIHETVLVVSEPYASRGGALRGLNRLFRRVGWPYGLAFPKTEKPKGVNT